MRNKETPEGISIVTKSFDAARRSWHLKIDFDVNKNMSLYIVERGAPSESKNFGENNLVPQFSSVLFTLELQKKRVPIFFSFAHNTNQLVGIKNLANLCHLSDTDLIDIKIFAKEQILHSALTQYLSNNFTKFFKIAAKSDSSVQSLYSLQPSTIFQILESNNLKVEDENTVLTFIYNYKDGRHIDLLINCIRYTFVDVSKLFSAIKQNNYFAESKMFKKRCVQEMDKRTKRTNDQYQNGSQ